MSMIPVRPGRRRLLAIALAALAVTLPTTAGAFDFDIHVEITRAGLVALLDNLTQEVPNLRREITSSAGSAVITFTPDALREVGAANKAMDTDDCGDKNNWTVAAVPCTKFLSQSAAAFEYLADEPPEEHFDAETIQRSSNYVLDLRAQIISFLRQGNYIGARKSLGRALHTIQDFYSHTNYVELGYRGQQIETRIATTTNSFRSPTGTPRLAGANEPTCLEGEYLFTRDTRDTLTKILVETRETIRTALLPSIRIGAMAKEKRIEAVIAIVDKAIASPALTSGFFVLDLPNREDPEEISVTGKCRHGWQRLGMNQAGIHKDVPDRSLHYEARRLATYHTLRFVVDLLKDPQLRNDRDYVTRVLGFLGYNATAMIHRVKVGIPGAPNGESWDTALRGILTFNLKNIQPDISVCVESEKVPGTCAPVCEDADWSNELNAYVCDQTLGAPGLGILADRNLRFLVREVDFGRPVRNIATFRVEDPRLCDPFCSLELEPGRTVWVQFDLKPAVAGYSDPRRTNTVGLPPPQSFPIAKPSSGGGSAPAPESTSTTTPPGGNSLSPNSRTAPLSRTPESIDTTLGLRDLDNCTGTDLYYPTSISTSTVQQLGPRAQQLYQMAAFAMAVTDPAAKQAVLASIQSAVGDDAFFAVMTSVIGNPIQAQAFVSAYQNTARNVAQQIESTGLTSLMVAPKPLSALQADVDRWIASQLSSPQLAAAAVDLMASGARPLTAECTLNELARQGFTLSVLGR